MGHDPLFACPDNRAGAGGVRRCMSAFDRLLAPRSFVTLAFVAGLLSLAGCKAAQQAVINATPDTPEVRAKVTESARKSCVDSAKKDARLTPETEPKVEGYCSCYATKVIAKFKTSELASLGIHGIDSLTPEEKERVNTSIAECKAEAGLE